MIKGSVFEFVKQRATIYVDMDGCIAKWQEVSEEETHEKGYFASLPAQLNLIKVVQRLQANGYDVKILTSVYEDDHSRADKEKWLKSQGLCIEVIFVPYGENKFEYIKDSDKTKFLIDDFGKNLSAWENFGKDCVSIKFMNQVNSRPKMEVREDGSMTLKQDSWNGYKIDYRMVSEQIYKSVLGIMMVSLIKEAA